MTEHIPSTRTASFLVALGLTATIGACRSNPTPIVEPELQSFDALQEVAASNFDDRYTKLLDRLLTRLGDLVVEPSPRAEIEIEGLPGPGALELQIALAHELEVGGSVAPVPIENGDVLRDGVGRDEQGDRIKISFRASRDCYVYAFAIDAAARAWPLFPVNRWFDHTNPVSSPRDYFFPKGPDWLYLSEVRGITAFYFVATLTRQRELEEMLLELDAREVTLEQAIAAPERVLEPLVLNRGVSSERPGAVNMMASDQAEHEVGARIYVAESPIDGLVVTRWYRHQ